MTISEELERIRVADGGVLYPRHVVDFARNETTELHLKFEWNNGVAAENYRIWQARKVITAEVTILRSTHDPLEIQTYVSMACDRTQEQDNGLIGGYRCMIDILKAPDLRKTLLEEAIEEFANWERKYQAVVELVDIFNAAKTVKQKQELIPATVS